MSIEVKNLTFSYGKNKVLKGVDFRADKGELIAVLGPNGAGKTTLFRNLLGFLKPSSGEILINGKPVESYSEKELAGRIAYIPQNFNPAFNHTVIDTVLMGVTSKLGLFQSPSEEDEKHANDVLKTLGISELANSGCMKISGGERQLMLIARALLQNAGILVMDEPASSLDLANTNKVLNCIKSLSDKGYTVFMSTHNPQNALQYASRILCIKEGKIIHDCKPEELTSSMIEEMYGVKVSICPVCGCIKIC